MHIVTASLPLPTALREGEARHDLRAAAAHLLEALTALRGDEDLAGQTLDALARVVRIGLAIEQRRQQERRR